MSGHLVKSNQTKPRCRPAVAIRRPFSFHNSWGLLNGLVREAPGKAFAAPDLLQTPTRGYTGQKCVPLCDSLLREKCIPTIPLKNRDMAVLIYSLVKRLQPGRGPLWKNRLNSFHFYAARVTRRMCEPVGRLLKDRRLLPFLPSLPYPGCSNTLRNLVLKNDLTLIGPLSTTFTLGQGRLKVMCNVPPIPSRGDGFSGSYVEPGSGGQLSLGKW